MLLFPLPPSSRCSNGAFKPNAAVQVGQLYAGDDHGRQWAYSVFYCGINLGAFLAPLVTGSVRTAISNEVQICGTDASDCAEKKEFDVRGFHAAFAVAGSAMALAMIIYIPGQKLLPPDTLADAPTSSKDIDGGVSRWCSWNLDPYVKRLLIALVVIVSLASVFWAVYEQQGNTITTFADTQVSTGPKLNSRVWMLDADLYSLFSSFRSTAFSSDGRCQQNTFNQSTPF